MKESEAREKWCPMARAVIGFEAGSTQTFNRFVAHPEDKEGKKITDIIMSGEATRCVGSKCMMWEFDQQFETKVVDASEEIPEGWHQTQPRTPGNKSIMIGRHVNKDTGDCGLKPCYNGCNYEG